LQELHKSGGERKNVLGVFAETENIHISWVPDTDKTVCQLTAIVRFGGEILHKCSNPGGTKTNRNDRFSSSQ